jgi:hypothetical protein
MIGIISARPTVQREGRQGQPRLHRVVLERHLEEDRERDHRAAQRDVLQQLPRDARPEVREREQARVEQRGLAGPLAPHEPPGEQCHRDGPDRDQQPDGLAALLPDENAEHESAHSEHGEDCAHDVDVSRSGVHHIVNELDLRQHDGDHDDLQAETDPPREVGSHKAADQRPHGGGDRGSGADQRVRLRPGSALEVPVDQ